MSKAQEWSARIARMKVSGLTAKAFAQQEGVNPHTLEWWRRQLRLREEEIGAPRPRFVAVEIAQDAPGVTGGFVVHVAGSGHRIEVSADFDAAALRRLVGALC